MLKTLSAANDLKSPGTDHENQSILIAEDTWVEKPSPHFPLNAGLLVSELQLGLGVRQCNQFALRRHTDIHGSFLRQSIQR